MALSTNMISGLSSGIDWQNMVTQLIAVDRKKEDVITAKQTAYSNKLKEWQSFNTKLLAMKTAAGNLKSAENFFVYKAAMATDNASVSAASLLSVTASETASIGSYTFKINHLATAQKLSSGSFSGASSALGDDYAGDIIINGSVITIEATDTLSSLKNKINNANSGATPTGVTASIISYGTNDARLTLTSDSTGAEGISLQNGGATDILNALGFTKTGVKGDVANTAAGSAMTSSTLLKEIDGYTGYASGDYVHLEGTDTNGNTVSNDTLILSDATTAGDLLTKIQAVFGDVTASITGSGKLSIVDNTTGTSPLVVKISMKDNGGADDATVKFDANGDLGSMWNREVVAGADASITVDGVTTTRSSNVIDDLIDGVTLNLLKADTNTLVTMNIGRDMDAIVSKVNAFVKSYNDVSSYIHTQSSYDATKNQAGGVLFGDGTLSSVKTDLTSILVQSVWGVSSDYSTMGLVGISVDKEGQLSVNDAKLRGYLQTNFNDVQQLFNATGTTSAGSLSYIQHENSTKAGEYTVHIDTAATRSTSAASDNISLTGDETLTIAEGSKTATVSLTSGMTMSQIVNAINGELANMYSQILAGGESLFADSGQAASITSATKLNSIYDSTGQSANLANGDVISFSGTNHSGVGVSGSYTISDVTTDSVQGLLSAIETAFNNQVTAAMDSSGRIVVTDKTEGSSTMALSFDYAQAHALDFGTVSTTNSGGQTGRYAMAITASADTGGHLVLAHGTYGSGHSFTIHQQNNLLWTGGDLTVDNGVDVAGTINGEAATGSGQTLTGTDGDANVSGLVVQYTGTDSGIDAGTIKLTLGVAELYDRALFHITDSVGGYVSFKQQSLQSSIDGFQKQIDAMEALLAKKQERMTNQFVTMELALQKIQSQSNWLAGQLNSASNGWQQL